MSVYDDNLVFLKEKYPRLLELIDAVPGGKCKTEPAKNGSLTLVYTHNHTPYYLHSRFNPQEESLKLLQKKDLAADHIVVLGLGLGYHLEKIMALKDPLSRVLLVEPDLELVRHSLATLCWHRLLKRRDFFYVLGSDLGQLAETLHTFINIVAFDKVEMIELPSETRILSAFFRKARETLEVEIKSYLYDFKTRLAESYMLPRNILKNLSRILKSRPLKNLKNAFSGTPGFIISAGPSLDKNVLFLKRVRDRGILIAVDTALKPLLKRSLQPHFTTIGDPSHKNYLHLLGSEKQLQHFIVAETGVAPQAFRDFPDNMFTLSIGRPLVRILEAHSEPLGEIEAWGSIISIALDFAVYTGLNPIIFVGQDFAFTGTRNHCRGTSWEELKHQYTRNLDELQRFEAQSIAGNRKVIETRDLYGDKIHTSDRLELYKNYLVRLLNKYPQVRFINATEGGIFSEIPHLPLYQAIKTFVYGRRPVELNRLRQIPTLNKRDNINRLLTFLGRGKEFFEVYLGKVQEALGLLETNTGLSPAAALPLLRQLEQVQEHLYAGPHYGDILEMWSTSPIYYFLREYQRIRNQPLDEATIRESFSIYERYFRNIKPLLEDMITHFKRAAGQLLELESSSRCGNWLIRCREGAAPTFASHNAYMFEAAAMRGLLYTLPELEREFPRIFEKPTQPLVLEVGCYLGHTVIELARHNPGLNVLGLDIKYKRVVKSARKIQRAQLSNAKIALCDVMEVMSVLPGNSLYGMFIFFPDPWIKERHEKYRYLNEDFFQMALSRLSAGGFIWLKTDRKTYFDAITAAAEQYGFSVSGSLPGKILQRPYRTLFEEIFTRKKVPYYQVILSR